MKKNLSFSLLSFVAGALLVFGFSPYPFWWLGLLSPALLLICWLGATPGQAFRRGFWFGLGEFGVGTSWIYISIHKFGNADVKLAGLITALFILLMATYPALQGYFFSKLYRRRSWIARCCLAFPALWVCFEALRSYLFTGFPWLALGYTQTDTLLAAYAPVISVFGISLVVTMLSGATIALFTPIGLLRRGMVLIMIGGLCYGAWALKPMTWTTPTRNPLSVALVQGNIAQSLKWDANETMRTIQKYVQATAPYWDYNLIVWPEASVPLLLSQAQGLVAELDSMAKQHGATLLFGIPISNADNTRYYNGMLAVGMGQGSYLKRHPVPFGEYIPLPSIFGRVMQYFEIPMSELSKGPAQQALIRTDHSLLAPFVCYEVTYPNEVVKYSRGSALLVTVNDDSWFGDSLAQPQQLQMARMRTLETGRAMLYASNTGITAIIDQQAKLSAVAPENVLTVLTGQVQPVTGETPLMRWYFYPLIGLISIMLLLALCFRHEHSK